ncbi:hypothetical protein CJ178_30145 [Rhodococcus sp. ACPA4]|uniref:hypothetical protein n=1 Tax=Rhodococcus sp. ACPA4 TaxID=2028571 RepID=UPI000BB0CEB0|nr:hypothetical protein [Rhodococcus sp. ACPA4]PBC35739.1 hypothetical protein CJ178_30145 [Rhodococcus sp. ACPA4]
MSVGGDIDPGMGEAPDGDDAEAQFQADLAAAEADENQNAIEIEMAVLGASRAALAADPALAQQQARPLVAVAGAVAPVAADVAVDPVPDPDDDAQNNALAAVEAVAAEAPQADRDYNLNRWALMFGAGGTLVGLASMIYTAVKDHESGSTDPSPNVPPAVDAQISRLCALWGTGSDTAFWTHLADYVDHDATTNDPLTFGDQVQFMNYTIDLWPDTKGWMWDTATDRARVVSDLIAEYGKQKKTSDMYRLVTTYQHVDASSGVATVMPRAVAAARLRLALAVVLYPVVPS